MLFSIGEFPLRILESTENCYHFASNCAMIRKRGAEPRQEQLISSYEIKARFRVLCALGQRAPHEKTPELKRKLRSFLHLIFLYFDDVSKRNIIKIKSLSSMPAEFGGDRFSSVFQRLQRLR